MTASIVGNQNKDGFLTVAVMHIVLLEICYAIAGIGQITAIQASQNTTSTDTSVITIMTSHMEGKN